MKYSKKNRIDKEQKNKQKEAWFKLFKQINEDMRELIKIENNKL